MEIEITTTSIVNKLGENLELDLDKKFQTFLPLNADWGYAFKVKVEKIVFDVIVLEDEIGNCNKIQISLDLNLFQKILKTNTSRELENLINEIENSISY